MAVWPWYETDVVTDDELLNYRRIVDVQFLIGYIGDFRTFRLEGDLLVGDINLVAVL